MCWTTLKRCLSQATWEWILHSKSLSESKKESLGINMSAQVNSTEYSVKKLLHFSLKTIQTTTTRGICQQTTNPMSSSWLGVNGVGKTTTIGKLAWQFKQAGKKVYLGAADTFRAAAVEQLCIWGERVGVPVVKQQMGSDPASVAFDTISSAKANGADVVLIDTAGRLHNKVGLMNELKKIKDVMKKVMPEAPDEVMLVLDGSTGQNAFEQAKQFSAVTQISSLAITKLDGTAKGGVVIGISDQLKVPVKYIGLGEGMTDLQLFNKTQFVDSLFKHE